MADFPQVLDFGGLVRMEREQDWHVERETLTPAGTRPRRVATVTFPGAQARYELVDGEWRLTDACALPSE